jgi:hypothetical protein
MKKIILLICLITVSGCVASADGVDRGLLGNAYYNQKQKQIEDYKNECRQIGIEAGDKMTACVLELKRIEEAKKANAIAAANNYSRSVENSRVWAPTPMFTPNTSMRCRSSRLGRDIVTSCD